MVLYETAGVIYTNPVFSPDGGSILLVSNHFKSKTDLLLIRPDGTVINNLTKGVGSNGCAVWSRDGRRIVFSSTRDGQSDIYQIRPDGTDLINLTNTSTEDERFPFYSPHGKKLIFSRGTIKKRRHEEGYEWNETVNNHLVIANADGTGQRIFAPDGWKGWWSPDSKWVVYTDMHGEGIWVQPVDGGERRRLVDGKPISWTPDGTAIFYRPPRRGIDQNVDVRRININGSGDRLVLKDYSLDYSYEGDPKRFWDPTASLLALVVYRMIGVRDGGVVIVDRDGNIVSDFREQGSGFDYEPTASWSADGNWVLFRKYHSIRGGGVYMVNVRSGEQRRVIADSVEIITKTRP